VSVESPVQDPDPDASTKRDFYYEEPGTTPETPLSVFDSAGHPIDVASLPKRFSDDHGHAVDASLEGEFYFEERSPVSISDSPGHPVRIASPPSKMSDDQTPPVSVSLDGDFYFEEPGQFLSVFDSVGHSVDVSSLPRRVVDPSSGSDFYFEEPAAVTLEGDFYFEEPGTQISLFDPTGRPINASSLPPKRTTLSPGPEYFELVAEDTHIPVASLKHRTPSPTQLPPAPTHGDFYFEPLSVSSVPQAFLDCHENPGAKAFSRRRLQCMSTKCAGRCTPF
jgi:hypothetical protein